MDSLPFSKDMFLKFNIPATNTYVLKISKENGEEITILSIKDLQISVFYTTSYNS